MRIKWLCFSKNNSPTTFLNKLASNHRITTNQQYGNIYVKRSKETVFCSNNAIIIVIFLKPFL